MRIATPQMVLLASFLLLFAFTSTGQTQNQRQSNTPPANHKGMLRFTFAGASWRDVLAWLADRADLALHVGETPTGSFTFSDRRFYTPDEAIDRINQFLIPKGFSLVRSGKLLSVISVEDTRSLKQLDALAKLVSAEDLKNLGDFEVVKCLFPLGKTDTETAVRELSAVTLMTEPVQLPNTNQLLITDTVTKLQTVQRIIATLANPTTDLGRVKSLPLENIDAESALAVIRPHVGLEGDVLIGGDISLSTDSAGKILYVSGAKEKVDIVMSLVETLKAPTESSGENKQTLQSHSVKSASLQMVYDVLQTLLAGEDVRLTQEPTTNAIVARAPAWVHQTIQETIAELSGSESDFKIIDLKSVDPYYAVSLLKEMFASPASDNANGPAPDQPMINADPINMRLFVWATPAQIEEIENVIKKLGPPTDERTSIRLLPYFGARGQQVLDSARKFWPGQNPLLIFPHSESLEIPERAIHPREKAKQKTAPGDRNSSPATDRQFPPRTTRRGAAKMELRLASVGLRQDQPSSKSSTLIRGQLTSRGILIQSNDLDALDRFEKHVRMIAGPAQGQPAHSVVFYLKYAPVDDAARFLSEVLRSTATMTNPFGSLVSGEPTAVNGSGAAVNRGRTNTWSATLTAGTATIFTDARLNRLIVLGSATDIALIENYLPIIDKDASLTDPQTHGAPRVIQLIHAPAEHVAAIIRDAYTGRIATSARERQQAALLNQRQQQQRNPQNQNRRGSQNQTQPNRATTQYRMGPGIIAQPKFTLAVDAKGNSLVVTASKQLADEVEQLARSIDQQNAQTVGVIRLKGVSSTYLQRALTGRPGDRSRRGSGGR